MKKEIWMLLCSLVMSINTWAQIVQENEMAIVYYMPYTNVDVVVDYDEEILTAGPFCHFTEEFLGIYDYIEQDEINYSLKKARVKIHTTPDTNRAYKIVASNDIPMQYLSLTKNGILYGYNVEESQKESENSSKTKKNDVVKAPLPAPYTEDQMKSQSLRAMAEATAKQIYRIRESRMYILGCEVEKAPADGKAMAIVLEELANQERQLVELFIGKREIKTHRETYHCTPSKNEEYVLARFDKKKGLLLAESEEGEPIMLTMRTHRQILGAATATYDKKAPQPSGLYYNLPGSCEAYLYYMDKCLDEYSFAIAQLGVSIPLAKNLFTGKQLPKILFDTKTGNIRSITNSNK